MNRASKQPQAHVFISHDTVDVARAAALEKALHARQLKTWRAVNNILPFQQLSNALQEGLRSSYGIVVLITGSSGHSEWVNFEYAFAMGAQVPLVVVQYERAHIPAPIRDRVWIQFSSNAATAKRIDETFASQSRKTARTELNGPALNAQFQHDDQGKLIAIYADDDPIPSYGIDLWMENVPANTHLVSFEIMDEGFRDNLWKLKRGKKSDLPFLTDDMDSWGDVEIRMVGLSPKRRAIWSSNTWLYQALNRYYANRPKPADIKRALRQIRDN